MDDDIIKKIKYLSDEPKKQAIDDELSHESIAMALKECIIKWNADESSYAIGLFGGWGMGKSTIGKFLRECFNKDQEKIAVVEFDIWKYEADVFRRQFLLFLNGDEGLKTDISEIKRMYQSISEEIESKDIAVSKISLVKLLLIIIAAVGLIFFIGGGFGNEVLKYIFGVVGLTSFLGFFTFEATKKIIEAVLKFLGKEMKNLLRVKTQTITEHRMEFAEQFEDLFDKIIQKARGIYEKIVIIIDNLDRVSDDKILELLSAVKTYLDKKNVAFVIQCDEDAIKRHLRHIYHKEEFTENTEDTKHDYADEFLRKFFNTFIRIPPFFEEDLDEYTLNLLKKTDAPFSEDAQLVTVISSAYRDNPRQIKQFINALISHYLLAYFREYGKGKPILQPEGIVTDYPSVLAKVIILNRDYSEFFLALKKNPHYWREIDSIIARRKHSTDESFANLINNNEKLKDFLEATLFVTTDDIKPFIYLKSSGDSLAIPLNNKLKIVLLDRKRDDASNILSSITKDKIVNYERFIINVLKEAASNELRIFNIINTLLYALSIHKIHFNKENFYNKIASYVSKSPYHIEGFEVDLIFSQLLLNIDRIYRSKLLNKYIFLFGRINEEKLDIKVDLALLRKSLSKNIAKSIEWFSKKQQKRIQAILEGTKFINNFSILEELAISKKSRDALFTSKHLELISKNINEEDLVTDEEGDYILFKKIEFIFNIKNKVNETTVDLLLQKLISLSVSEKGTSEQSVIKLLNDYLEKTLRKFTKIIKESSDSLIAISKLNEAYNKVGDYELKKLYVKNLILIKEILENSESEFSHISSLIEEFINTAPLSAIKELFDNNKTQKGVTDLMLKNYKQILNQRAINDRDFITFLLDTYKRDDLEYFLNELIDKSSYYALAIDKVERLGKNIKQKNIIASSILNKADAVAFPEKSRLMKALTFLKYKDADFISSVSSKLAEFIYSEDTNIQNGGNELLKHYQDNSYFDDNKTELVMTKVLDHFASIPVVNISYSTTLNMLAENIQLLSDKYRDDLASLIIEKFVINNLSAENMDLAVSLIRKAKLTYSKSGSCFEKLLNKIEEVIHEHETKKQLLNELKKVKNVIGQRSKVAKDFWSRVNSLSRNTD